MWWDSLRHMRNQGEIIYGIFTRCVTSSYAQGEDSAEAIFQKLAGHLMVRILL